MRLLNRLRDERAYTMVEMITVMVIMSIVMTGISTVFVQGSNAELDMNNRFQAQSNARLALDTLRRDVHCSKWVTNPSTPQLTTAQTTITMADPCAIHTTLLVPGALSSANGSGNSTLQNIIGFPSGSNVLQIDSEQVLGTLTGSTFNVTSRGVNDTLPAAHLLGARVTDPDGLVSWCAVTVSGDTGLYRQLNTSGSTCGSASPAVRQMDRLTTTGVFWNQPSWAGGGFAQVYVKLPVNTATAKHLGSSTDTYTLCDGITLRNSIRSGTHANGTGFITPPAGC